MPIETSGIIPLPNPSKLVMAKNPHTWPQEVKKEADMSVAPTLEEKTLYALENAIALLDIARMNQKLLPDEIRTTLNQLRSVRVEYLKIV